MKKPLQKIFRELSLPFRGIPFMIGIALKTQKSVLLFVPLLAFSELGRNLAGLLVSPVILGKVEEAAPLGELFRAILLFTFLLIVFNAACAYIETNAMFGRIAVRSRVISMLHRKMCVTSFPNTEDTEVREKWNKAGLEVDGNSSSTEAVWKFLGNLLRDSAGLIIYVFMLSSAAPNPVLLTVVGITTAVNYFFGLWIQDWEWRHREEKGKLQSKMWYIVEKSRDLAFAKDVRLFGMGGWLKDIYLSTNRLYMAFILKREKINLSANILDVLLTVLRNGLAYYYLISVTLKNGMPAAEFLLYFSAVGGFTSAVKGFCEACGKIVWVGHGVQNVRDFLDLPESFRFENGEPLPKNGQDYEIELRDVSFRYPGADKDILTDFNLKIRPGEKLAIVGLNGAGKTTLVKLICGFYDPTKGEVLLNGRDIRLFNRHDYYSLFSAVFQQVSLLEVSLTENIASSDTDIDLSRAEACVEKAGLTEKVKSLPSGGKTHIGRRVWLDGVELSGGETQRLLLARALYKDAPVLVLDEPTAALDPIAENDIYLKYNGMTAGRTAVYISHRLASTRFCDRILFIENGGIAEEGTHEALLRLNGRYAELFRVQSKYYREGGQEDEE
ncbi:MAG: ABC transporter ATP-binding protein [Oscillospiraceae bacterium]|nr:ABC transporter ATP-binding protein [Oscillospiraceae bacterium]